MDFTEDQIARYARHIILDEVGGVGQAALVNARVLLVGAGGLGSPVALYLAAAGVGTLGVVDADTVDLSNLQRQIAHATSDVGRRKVESLAETVRALNPDVTVEAHPVRLDVANAESLITRYDVVVDGTDNFATRYLLNDACYFAGKTLISAALLRFEGQLSTFKAHLRRGAGSGGVPDAGAHPCYRCLFRDPPPRGVIPSCAEAGILGVLAGTMGCLQATEVLKEILGIGSSLSGTFLIYNALDVGFRTLKVRADPACPLCGTTPSIVDLSVHRGGA